MIVDPERRGRITWEALGFLGVSSLHGPRSP